MKKLILLFILIPTGLNAHTQWADGTEVPAWVSRACCGPDDVHHLTPEQVTVVPGGYRVEGYSTIIPKNEVLPSMDSEYWGFWRNLSDGTQSRMFCFFVPAGAV